MKSLFSFLTLFTFTFTFCNAQTTYPSGVTGCVARWDFTNSGGVISTVNDVSLNGHDGAANNLSTASGYHGIPNTAMHFDGSTGYALVPHNSQLNLQQLTIVALVDFDHFYSGNCQESEIISKGYPYGVPGEYGLGVGDNAYDRSCSIFSPNNQQMDYQLDAFAFNPSAGNYISSDTWYFLAMTYDGDTMNTYQVIMDPAIYYSTISPLLSFPGFTHALDSLPMPISIGRHMNPSYPYWFAGDMDELVLFNRALSPEEMESVYTYLWGGVLVAGQLNSSNSNDPIELFPNPNSGEFVLNGFSKSGKTVIEISDCLGRSIYSESFSVSCDQLNKKIVLDKNVCNGIYLLKLINNNQTIIKRFELNR